VSVKGIHLSPIALKISFFIDDIVVTNPGSGAAIQEIPAAIFGPAENHRWRLHPTATTGFGK
jgi:hypothetical protein